MEKGRFPDWQPEGSASETDGSKPESDKKKKRRKDDAASSQPAKAETPAESDSKKTEVPEHERVRKALGDFFVERGGSAESKRTGREEVREGEGARVEAERTTKPAAELAQELDGESTDEVDSMVDSHDKLPEPEEDEREEEVLRPGNEQLRSNRLSRGEIIIDLQGDTPLTEREIPLREAPPDAVWVEAEHVPEAEPELEPALKLEREPEAPVEALHDEADHEPDLEPVRQTGPGFEPFTPPVFQLQAEQPSQPRVYETAPAEEFISTASTHGSEAPPGNAPETEPTAEGLGIPQESEAVPVAAEVPHRPEPAAFYRMSMGEQAVQETVGSASGEPMVSKREADDAVYYAAKAAQSRGLVTGLFVAALWARHRGKKLRRQFNKRFRKQDKELQQVRDDQHWYETGQAKRQAETDRRLAMAEQRYAYAEKQLAARERAGLPLASPEVIAGAQNNSLPQSPERVSPEASEQMNIPPEHRLEASAWHTIEVDARTGRPVEQPAFVYGHEYYRERSHESAPVSQRTVAAGEVALAGAAGGAGDPGSSTAGSTSNQTGTGAALPPNIPSASMQGPPSGGPTSKDTDASGKLTKATANGPVWPLVVALLVIFIILIVLLH